MLDASRWLLRVIGNAAYRFYWDDCFSRASSLAYTTLFALVPVSALSFSMFSAFHIDQQQTSRTITSMLSQFLPPIENDQLRALRGDVLEYLTVFSENVSALNTLSVAVLCFTAVALINTIESALNVVWRVSSKLSIMSKIINFWAVMTLGPLLLVVSFIWYGKVNAMAGSDQWVQSNILSVVDFLIPVSSTWLALTLLFFKLPAAKVRLHDAAIGAFFSAVVFEFVKRGFAWYISLSTTYSTIYGVLTTIPIFLFWLYVTWVVVLFGAEISYQAGSIAILRSLRKYSTDLGDVGAVLGLRVLYTIGRAFLRGDGPPSEGDIARETGADPVRVRTCLDILTEADILTVSDPNLHNRALIKSPERLTLGDIINTFRSKEYRFRWADVSKDPGQLPSSEGADATFLEVIRKAANRLESSRTVETWTLREFIGS